MSDAPPPTPAEKAATRRRWITIGEVVAISGLVISGLTFWDGHRAREREEAERTSPAAAPAARLVLKGTANGSGTRISLAPARSEQSIQTQRIEFPSALGVDAVETTGDARIETRWFADALRKARDRAGQEGATTSDERLPVLVTTTFIANDVAHTDRALYDIGYAVSAGGLFDSGDVSLRGLSLVQANAAGDAKRLDAIWSRRMPAKVER